MRYLYMLVIVAMFVGCGKAEEQEIAAATTEGSISSVTCTFENAIPSLEDKIDIKYVINDYGSECSVLKNSDKSVLAIDSSGYVECIVFIDVYGLSGSWTMNSSGSSIFASYAGESGDELNTAIAFTNCTAE